MAWKVKEQEEKKERVNFDLMKCEWSVSHVRVLSEYCVSFNLDLSGVSLYGCKLCESRDEKKFITPNQTKVGDKYYNNYGLFLSEENEKLVIEEVESRIESA